MEHIALASTASDTVSKLPTPIIPEFMTVTSFAKLFRVHRSTVARWIDDGKIKATQNVEGGNHLIHRDEAVKIMNS